jgi:hypothetical protein
MGARFREDDGAGFCDDGAQPNLNDSLIIRIVAAALRQ